MLRSLGSLFWALVRGAWWLLLALWTQPIPRLILAVLLAWWGWGLWLAAVVSWGDPLVSFWPFVAGAGAGLLVSAAASSIHHLAPQMSRQIAVGRTAAYAVALLPVALAVGTWVGGLGAMGHVFGIVAEIAMAAGLRAHLRRGPELRT